MTVKELVNELVELERRGFSNCYVRQNNGSTVNTVSVKYSNTYKENEVWMEVE